MIWPAHTGSIITAAAVASVKAVGRIHSSASQKLAHDDEGDDRSICTHIVAAAKRRDGKQNRDEAKHPGDQSGGETVFLELRIRWKIQSGDADRGGS